MSVISANVKDIFAAAESPGLYLQNRKIDRADILVRQVEYGSNPPPPNNLGRLSNLCLSSCGPKESKF